MNKVVREHFPASRLPAELRGPIDPSSDVTVVVTEEVRPKHVMSLEDILSLKGLPSRSVEEIDADLRELREEWHDRQ